jgi:hypothetical protein
MKISFDFDWCLSKGRIQKFCKKLIRTGFDVWITTSRSYQKGRDQDLYDVAKKLGIPNDRITFTGGFPIKYPSKSIWLKDKNFLCHFDDDSYELQAIKNNCSTLPIDVKSEKWKQLFYIYISYKIII